MKSLLHSGILLIASLLLITACGGPGQPPMPPTAAVFMDTAEVKEAVYYESYPGNVIALNSVQLNSEVSGFITGIYFQEGQQVRKGQKLYEIEQAKFAAAYSSADAALRIAKANQTKASKDDQRYKELGQKGMTTQQRLEYSEVDLENANSQVASAQANLLRAATDLKHATIYAPFDGTIGISQVKLGAFVSAGQTRLNTVSSNDPMAVDFVISEKEISRFLELEKRKLTKYDSLFTIALPDKSLYPYPGKIAFLDRAVDPQTGTLKIRLNFPNPQRALRDGMSCNIRVANKHDDQVVVIPNKAVTEQMGEFFVYVIEKDTAHQHKVTLGPVIGKNIVVLDGLKAGEVYAYDGLQKLRDNVPVLDASKMPPPDAAAKDPNKK